MSIHKKKKILITKLKKINNKDIANFINSSESTIIAWKRENPVGQNRLFSATIGTYLFSQPNPVIEQLKNQFENLKEKLKKEKMDSKFENEVIFFETFFKDIDNMKETIFS